MVTLEVLIIVIAVAILGAPAAFIQTLGQKELLVPSMLQAIRWVAVGFVIAVAAEAYLSTNFFSLKLLWGSAPLAFLTVVEYYLLKIERQEEEPEE